VQRRPLGAVPSRARSISLRQFSPLRGEAEAKILMREIGMTYTTQVAAPTKRCDGITSFGSDIRGSVLRPEDPGYNAARSVWNGMIDRRPALIVRCSGAADVIACVRFARDSGLPLAVRGGGHNVAGSAVCDDGLVIDLSAMKGINVEPSLRSVRVQPGVLWGELDYETQAFGLATTGGIVTHTGVAGLTLGGGIGWLMRKHGLTCDNLLSADVVTADGRFVRADERENADLMWGLRGGGGNFGIVTSFEFGLHPVGPQVLAGVLLHASEHASPLLRFYRDYIAAAPEELSTIVNLRRAPPAPFLPPELHGRAVVIIAACYAGPVSDGERVLAPLRRFGKPLIDLIKPTKYTNLQGMFDASVPHGLRYYWKSHYLPPLSDAAIDGLIAHAWRASSPSSYTILFHLGGAIRRIDGPATAFEDRSAEHALNINAVWNDAQQTADHIAWARSFWEGMRPLATGGVYVNFLGDEGDRRVREAYGSEKYQRLSALKQRYDPMNLFRHNQNIPPAAKEA
jgi:FAD/FMN-containing dehydrogenase